LNNVDNGSLKENLNQEIKDYQESLDGYKEYVEDYKAEQDEVETKTESGEAEFNRYTPIIADYQKSADDMTAILKPLNALKNLLQRQN